MQIENNKTLTNLVIVFISFLILQSLFGLLSSYVLVPLLSKSQGYDSMAGYYKVQGFIYNAFNLIDFILLLIIGIQLKHVTIRILVFVYAFLQLGWTLFSLFSALTGGL